MLPALPADALVRAELLRLCEQLRELSAPAGPRGLPARDERGLAGEDAYSTSGHGT